MNTKLTFVAYPTVAVLALAAAFAAHAQSRNDPADSAAYGATPFVATLAASRADVRALAVPTAGNVALLDADRAAYGPTVVPKTFQFTRAEVMAEAAAAREAGYDLQFREGGDVQFAAMQRRRGADATHVLAAAPVKPAVR
jgi:hypothetical protein